MKRWLVLVVPSLWSLALIACSGDDGSDGDDVGDDNGGDPAGGLVDESGNQISSVGSADPVAIAISGLNPNSQYFLNVTGPGGTQLSPAEGFIATTDEDGNIMASTVVQDLGSTAAAAARFRATGQMRAEGDPGDYEIAVQNDAAEDVLTIDFTVTDSSRVFCADSSGIGRASFTPGETVYANLTAGDGNLEDGTYSCYVIPDLNEPLAENDPLPAIGAVDVTVADGSGLVALGASFPPGAYDVVCDIDDLGFYTPGTDLISRSPRFHPCFTVQEANSGGDIIGQVCSDMNGNYRDIFDPNATDVSIRDVWAWIAPHEQSLVMHAIGVRKYVVAHQETWIDGDELMDVTAEGGASAFELDSVQGFCTNEAPWMVWPRARLTAGCFDCIVDVDADGVYTQGTDFVDNIDLAGDNTTCGMRVSDTACDDLITIDSPEDGDEVDATAIALIGSFGETLVSGRVIVTSGRQSNTINLTPEGGTFSANIPLFNGDNFLTVAGTEADGTTCGKTISVRSMATSSMNELFRVQLTWDGDTDMDLHLVRPEGSYSNGGSGTDDCNYGNCVVGLDGLGSNSIDWGTVAEEGDDPKLDVDCVACGNGIENIWMNEINEDGTYDVYVDAFSGSETAVNVSVFIKGASVGTVACGAMSSGDASTDSCFAGTITWTGGSEGTGQFTAVGEKAGDF